MKRIKLLFFCLLVVNMVMKAQIGYQISLLNTATGEPRSNETVSVSVNLTNNAGEMIYSETKSETTNDFGVLSLSIGNANMFENVDFTKMPFYIEVSANGVTIGKSQILSVPVAEYAKRSGNLTKDILVGTWENSTVLTNELTDGPSSTYKECAKYHYKYVFNNDGTGIFISTITNWSEGRSYGDYNDEFIDQDSFRYSIDGNQVILLKQCINTNYNYSIYDPAPHAMARYETLPYFSDLKVLGHGLTKQ